ncbi:MAG TPA: PsiF family protein [Nitrospiraceae bacterium]|nr:PsiF family protein [Nitrospiraceae bacterium]
MLRMASIIMAATFFSLNFYASPFAVAAQPKQHTMESCNAQANEKGFDDGDNDERKVFMKECLSTKPIKTGGTQQSKMKFCNKEAGDKKLKGNERKAFMKTCLSS